MVELRRELGAIPPFRLPARNGRDGLTRLRGGVLQRLLHHGEEPVLVRAAQTEPDRVLLGAWAQSEAGAEHGVARMEFALGLDVDVRRFHELFASDPHIGPSVRRRPWLRVMRRPQPFEALAFAICEQLIEYERAAAIERRIVAKLGRRWELPGGLAGVRASAGGRGGVRASAGGRGGSRERSPAASMLRDSPTAAALAAASPALLQSLDLGAPRARALVRAAREVATGRIDLDGLDHERAWSRLRAIRGIGSWTVEMLAVHGQGREDQVPAGDLGLLKAVGRRLGGGDPHAFAEESEVRDFFRPYGQWAGLAAAHLLVP